MCLPVLAVEIRLEGLSQQENSVFIIYACIIVGAALDVVLLLV